MKGNAEFKIVFKSEDDAENALISLTKEMNSNKRFSSEIKVVKNFLIIVINAEDIVALRATSNSFLRYLQIIEKL